MNEFSFGENADHAGIVGAEFWIREEKADTGGGTSALEFGAECAITGDAAGGGDALHVKPFGGADCFLDENIDDCGLDAGADVADGVVILHRFGVIAQEVADGSF